MTQGPLSALNAPEEIRRGEPAHDARNALHVEGVGQAAADGRVLTRLLDIAGVKAGFQRDLVDQLLVVVGNAQPFGELLADGPAAAAKFAADGDDAHIHA